MEHFAESEHYRVVSGFTLPRYHQLPDFRLYVDQVIELVEGALLPLSSARDEKWITPTMIGNYVKQGVIPRPIGKRYTREHVAYLIFLCCSKQVLAIGEVQALVDVQKRTFPLETAYDYFCTEFEGVLEHVFTGATLKPDSSRTGAYETRLIRSVAFAVAHKIYLSHYLRFLTEKTAEAPQPQA